MGTDPSRGCDAEAPRAGSELKGAVSVLSLVAGAGTPRRPSEHLPTGHLFAFADGAGGRGAFTLCNILFVCFLAVRTACREVPGRGSNPLLSSAHAESPTAGPPGTLKFVVVLLSSFIICYHHEVKHYLDITADLFSSSSPCLPCKNLDRNDI